MKGLGSCSVALLCIDCVVPRRLSERGGICAIGVKARQARLRSLSVYCFDTCWSVKGRCICFTWLGVLSEAFGFRYRKEFLDSIAWHLLV